MGRERKAETGMAMPDIRHHAINSFDDHSDESPVARFVLLMVSRSWRMFAVVKEA